MYLIVINKPGTLWEQTIRGTRIVSLEKKMLYMHLFWPWQLFSLRLVYIRKFIYNANNNEISNL